MGGGGGASSGPGGGGLLAIINSRLSPRGRIQPDPRTNSLIITDLADYVQVVEEMIARLDRPDPQVEIEARIVIASRNFLRDIGTQLAGGATGAKGRAGIFETSPVQLGTGSLTGGTSSSGSSGSSGSGSGSTTSNPLGPNLVGGLANGVLGGGAASSVLSLTTGVLGTGILSLALSASETKGQARTVAAPRVTAQDNERAEIVNGVQIPVQTVSNNTVTTTFITAALRLEITPQIIEETGEVLMHVVAENNTVNLALAGQFNNGTPGINTQSAESTVRVQDGGTTVMGGINVDSEGNTINRTPGISRVPILGELFKHRNTTRNTDEILFFITPRIVKGDGFVGPRNLTPLRSSVEGTPNPTGTQRVADTKATPQTDKSAKPTAAPAPPVTAKVAEAKTSR